MTVSRKNGIRYGEIHSSHGASSLDTIVLLHGLGNSLDFWNAVAPLLGHRARIIAPDIPGFGESDRPPTFALSDYRSALVSLMDDLDVISMRLVGHSMGALIAMDLASSLNQRVTNLTLVDGHLFTAVKTLHSPLAGLSHPKIVFNLAMQWIGGTIPLGHSGAEFLATNDYVRRLVLWPFVHRPSDLDQRLVAGALAHGGGLGPLRALITARELDMERLASQVPCPTRLIWGANDPLLMEQDLESAHRLMDIEWASAIPNCGHWPMLEAPVELSHLLLK